MTRPRLLSADEIRRLREAYTQGVPIDAIRSRFALSHAHLVKLVADLPPRVRQKERAPTGLRRYPEWG